MKLLVTGATGKLGTLVMEHLLKTVPASQLAVAVRNPQKAEHLRSQGVDVRQADYTQQATLEAAFAGIDRLLLISSDGGDRISHHKNAVSAAVAANVKFIAYTSLAKADHSALFLAPDHRATEQLIKDSGIPYSILRNNWYLENEESSIQGVLAGAPWLTSAAHGKVGWALRRDYAEAAARVLAGDGQENTVYELSGKPLSQAELAAALGAVLEKEVPVILLDDAGYGDAMKGAGVPDAVLPFLLSIQEGIRSGELDVANSDFEQVLGRPLTPIDTGLRELVANLSAK